LDVVEFKRSCKLKKCEQTEIFGHAAHASTFSPCSVRSKDCDFGMWADVGRQIQTFLPWFDQKLMVSVSGENFWPQQNEKIRKAIVIANAARN